MTTKANAPPKLSEQQRQVLKMASRSIGGFLLLAGRGRCRTAESLARAGLGRYIHASWPEVRPSFTINELGKLAAK